MMMSFSVFGSMMIAFLIVVLSGKRMIPFLLRLKVGQTVRDDGPQTHLKKNGTPTMGGAMILIAFLIGSLPFAGAYPEVIPVVVLTVGFGLIGFADDYIKVVLKRSLGLRAWQKLVLQVIVTAVFYWYLVPFSGMSLAMKVPFMNGYYLDFGWLNVPILFFIVIGTVNGTNFTDGLDGLASSVTAVVAAFFLIVSLILASGIDPVCGAMMGALMGFLVYNLHPAKVFMGDTGSLALGGFVAGAAYLLQMPIFIALVGVIYLIEVLSVMLQVGYFKATHGKRIFKMAPIHHHFEQCGWSETRIVGIFTIITVLASVLAITGVW